MIGLGLIFCRMALIVSWLPHWPSMSTNRALVLMNTCLKLEFYRHWVQAEMDICCLPSWMSKSWVYRMCQESQKSSAIRCQLILRWISAEPKKIKRSGPGVSDFYVCCLLERGQQHGQMWLDLAKGARSKGTCQQMLQSASVALQCTSAITSNEEGIRDTTTRIWNGRFSRIIISNKYIIVASWYGACRCTSGDLAASTHERRRQAWAAPAAH